MALLLASGFLLLIGIFRFTTTRNFRQSPIFGIESTVNRLVTHLTNYYEHQQCMVSKSLRFIFSGLRGKFCCW